MLTPLKPEEIARRAKKCTHFNGMQNNACEAGINYKSLPERKWGQFICFGESHGCEKYVAQGEAQVLADHEAAGVSFGRTITARKAITDHTHGKRGIAGKIDCPICKVKEALHFSVSGYNGHIHAQCATENCVAWME
jgi:hypothetical protein